MKKFLKIFFLSMMLPVAACNAQSDTAADGSFAYTDGVDFQTLLRPVATQDPSKVELAEVFWYGCIHCYRLEPILLSFAEDLPEGTDFVKVPAVWHASMELHARVYYAAEVLGADADFHWGVFKAMNEDRNTLPDNGSVLKLVEKLGQDPTAFGRALNSFGVTSQVNQAKSKAAAYGIRGTPELIVNGKYRISTTMTGTQDRMLEVARALVERELAAMGLAQ